MRKNIDTRTMWFYHRILCPKDADRMANNVDPDQEQSDLGLHCLPRPVCPKALNPHGTPSSSLVCSGYTGNIGGGFDAAHISLNFT